MMVQETRRTAPTAAAAPIANAIAVASGKGGVGKTWLSITLAHALANLGRRTVLIDGDLGLANVDIQLGLSPELDLTRTYWLMSHPDTHHTRRVAEVYDFVAKSVAAAKASFVTA